ncbi:MAG: TetR/AcrR family transcriptional regulator [Lachnospiraceae bacterium]|nr:TetR/AcrR family transcriptional regulator [Lachnospiraceae bacterium]
MSTVSSREKILESALTLFSQKGFDGTSVEEIAAECGMKAPNLYKYFKGKEDIIDGLNDYIENKYQQSMKRGVNNAVWIHNAEELKMYSLGQIRFTMTDDMMIRVRKMLALEQFRNEFYREKSSFHQVYFLQKQFSEIFKFLIKQGTIEDDDPEMLAIEFFAPVSILMQLSDREPDKKDEVMGMIELLIDRFIKRCFK